MRKHHRPASQYPPGTSAKGTKTPATGSKGSGKQEVGVEAGGKERVKESVVRALEPRVKPVRLTRSTQATMAIMRAKVIGRKTSGRVLTLRKCLKEMRLRHMQLLNPSLKRQGAPMTASPSLMARLCMEALMLLSACVSARKVLGQ